MSKRIRWSLLTLVFGSLIGVIALLLRGPVPLPNVDVDAWAWAVTGKSYNLAQILLIVAYVIPFFGFWAIYAVLQSEEKVEKLAFWGFMGGILGTALAMPTLGIFSFMSPPLAQGYLGGNDRLPDLITRVAFGRPAIINLSGGTIYLLGMVLLGLAIWRSGNLPKWTGLMMALHGLALVFGFTLFPVLVLGWVLLLIAGLWLFVGIK